MRPFDGHGRHAVAGYPERVDAGELTQALVDRALASGLAACGVCRAEPYTGTERAIAERLYASDMPEPDLLIRTSGEMRISNFLLWEAAYSEMWFTPVFWPDFDREVLFEAIRDFQKRERRFGAIAEDA